MFLIMQRGVLQIRFWYDENCLARKFNTYFSFILLQRKIKWGDKLIANCHILQSRQFLCQQVLAKSLYLFRMLRNVRLLYLLWENRFPFIENWVIFPSWLSLLSAPRANFTHMYWISVFWWRLLFSKLSTLRKLSWR